MRIKSLFLIQSLLFFILCEMYLCHDSSLVYLSKTLSLEFGEKCKAG